MKFQLGGIEDLFSLEIQGENSKSCFEVVKMFFQRFEVTKVYFSS